MLIEIVAYSLIAFQLESVLCAPQRSQSFNGSNPYYDSYLDQYGNDNSFSNNQYPNPYSATQKPLYPTLHPQAPTTPPQPYYVKGHHNPTPQPNYFNRNSSFQNPINTSGGSNNSYGWNNNFNSQTTSSSYQPYGQYITTTPKPPVTTLPPFYPNGSFNQYNRTSSVYPAGNRTNPTYPSYRPQPTYPSTYPQPNYPTTHSQSNYPSTHPQPTYPSTHPQPNYPNFHNNRTQPTPNYNHGQRNFTNNYNNTFPNTSWNRNNTSYQYPSYPSQNTGQGTKTNNNNNNNYNFNRNDNNYSPQYRPSAPAQMPQGNSFTTKPHFDQNGIPLATFATFHANMPITDQLFNYDNLHRRRPNNGMETASYEQSVPLAPFPGSRAPTYDSNSNVPLAPFPG